MIPYTTSLLKKLIVLLVILLLASCQSYGEPIVILTNTPSTTQTVTSTATITPTYSPSPIPPIDTRVLKTPSPEEQAALNKLHRQLVTLGFEGDMSRQSLLNLNFIPDLSLDDSLQMNKMGVLLARVDGEYMVILNLSAEITISFNPEGDDGYRAFYLEGSDNILLAKALATSLQIPLHWLELNIDTSSWPNSLIYSLEWSGTILLHGIEPIYGSWGNPGDQMVGLTYCDFQGHRTTYISSGPPDLPGCSPVPVMAYYLDGRALSPGDLILSLMSHAQHLSTTKGEPIMISHYFVDVPFEFHPINPWTIPKASAHSPTRTPTLTLTQETIMPSSTPTIPSNPTPTMAIIPTVQMVIITDTHTPSPTISPQTP